MAACSRVRYLCDHQRVLAAALPEVRFHERTAATRQRVQRRRLSMVGAARARCAQRTRQPHTACARGAAPPPASAREHTVGRQRSPSPAAQLCARGRASSAALRRATRRCWKGSKQSVISFDSSAPPPRCASARDDECLCARRQAAPTCVVGHAVQAAGVERPHASVHGARARNLKQKIKAENKFHV